MFPKYVKIACYLLAATVLVTISFRMIHIALPESLQEQIGSTDERQPPSNHLFFTVYDPTQDTVQIWRRDITGTTQYSFLELPTQYPASGLPIQELALLRHRYCLTQQNNCSVENLALNFSLGGLSLSPDEEWLAWSEEAAWCPGTQCYGIGKFAMWNVGRGERQELLEIPSHIEKFATQTISEMTWSPDSKEIGFIHSSQDNGWSRVRVIDVETK